MLDARINLLAVGVSAIVYWLLGAAWFTVLKQPWLEGIGKTIEQVQKDAVSPGVAYTVALVCNLLIAYTLGWVLVNTGEQSAMRGVVLGAMLWVGLVATTWGTADTFAGHSLQGFVISAGYPLAGFMIMGAIVGAWKK